MSRTSEYRRFQDYLHNIRLRNIMNSSSSVWWNDYCNPRYLKRYYYGNAYFKRVSNKKIRNANRTERVPKGNFSHKYYDYWWQIT